MNATTLEDRFMSKVDTSGDCWLWTATLRRGYGCLSIDGRLVYAHRAAYGMFVGPIPEGKYIDHICRNKRCVRPLHLRPTTVSENGQNHGGPQANSKSGVRGVIWCKQTNRWRVRVMCQGARYNGGYFDSLEEAERRAVALRNILHTHNDLDRDARLGLTPTTPNQEQ